MKTGTDTVIFDIGMVLMEYDWEKTLRRLVPDEKAYEGVADAVFRNPSWVEHDRGLLSEDEELADFISNAPEYAEEIRLAYAHLGDTVETYPYTMSWIKELKAGGYRVYALSNWHYHMFDQARDKMMKFLGLMDGYMFSFAVHLSKPDKAVFRLLLEKYAIVPERAVFIDDTVKNVEAAREVGIRGIVCRSFGQVRSELEKMGVPQNGPIFSDSGK